MADRCKTEADCLGAPWCRIRAACVRLMRNPPRAILDPAAARRCIACLQLVPPHAAEVCPHAPPA